MCASRPFSAASLSCVTFRAKYSFSWPREKVSFCRLCFAAGALHERLAHAVIASLLDPYILIAAGILAVRALTFAKAGTLGWHWLVLIGFFSWFYPARIVRATVFQLRRQDFIEAARMVGASTPRTIRSHMLPHLVGPIAVYFAIIADPSAHCPGVSWSISGCPVQVHDTATVTWTRSR